MCLRGLSVLTHLLLSPFLPLPAGITLHTFTLFDFLVRPSRTSLTEFPSAHHLYCGSTDHPYSVELVRRRHQRSQC
ncbi:hypothetical protein BGW80DRAFT_1314407 [Lactifluus volemus]|nr:hypothetical protein BGW80DRAFT_1314407 [Lactifluus volemus]